MLKKILIGILIALVVLAGIWGYFLYTGDQTVIRTWIANNPVYTSIFFVSICSVYFLQGKNKIFRFLILIIVLVNLFIIGDVFFRNNIGLTSQQFIILFWLIILALAASYIRHRVRIIVIVLIGLGIGFVLLTGILPLYESLPNVDNFLQSQKPQIINQWASEWKITIKNILGNKEIEVKKINKENIDLSQKTQIIFASKINEEEIFIHIKNGWFINIGAQSVITLEQTGTITMMQIFQWNIEYYIPEEYSGSLKLIGSKKWKHIKNIEQANWGNIITYKEQEQENFFIESLWGELILNPTIDKCIKFFIMILYKINPEKYQKNLNNYNTIQEYLGNFNEENNQYTGESVKSMISDIRSQAKKWTENTKNFNTLF